MGKLTLPIHTNIPLEVLARRVDEMSNTPLPGSQRWSRTLATRLIKRCQEHGIDYIWILMLYPWETFVKLKNCGVGTRNLADEILESVGGEFREFWDLTETLEIVAETTSYRDGGGYVSFSRVVMDLAGIDGWEQDSAIIAALAEHGLRPGMPIEELFVYVPVVEPAEPEKLTVTEELLYVNVNT